MKTSRLLILIALAIPLSVVAEQLPTTDISPVDTSQWKCKYCVVEEGWNGNLDFGLGYTSADSYKFGEYTGLKEKEGFFVGNANIFYRSPEANFLILRPLISE